MKMHIGARVRDLDIRGERPAVHFLLNSKEPVYTGTNVSVAVFNELRTEEVTDDAETLFFRLKDFLESRQHPTVRWPWLLLAAMSFAATIGCIVYSAHQHAVQVSVLCL